MTDNEEIVTDDMMPDNTNADLKAKVIESFLQIKGVGPAMAEKLWDAQYYSLMDIGASPVGDFMERTGMPKATAEKVISNARGLANIGGITTLGEQMTEERPLRLSTGSREFDAILGGGYPTKTITELFAENGVAKSQCCFTATVMATLPVTDGGLDGHVLYIDTEGTFSPQRVVEIINSRGYNVNDLKDRIHILNPRTVSEQILMMDQARKLASEVDLKLIVVDSLIGHFRAEYCGRGVLAERQQLLSKYLSELYQLANNNNAVALITSQVSATPDGFAFGPSFQACGGNAVHHRTSHRIMLRKGKAGMRIARLVKSPYLPEGEAVFVVNERGVTDKGKS